MADLQASKIDKANHLLLDQPLLRLPYELLRNNFRSAHFTVEKESVAVKNALKESATAGLSGRASSDDVLRSLDAMLTRMRGVKRKLESCAADEAKLYRQVDARLAHLAELAGMHSLDDVAYEAWSRRRLDRLLVDYLLRHGYGDSAEALVADDASGALRDLVDMDTFAHVSRIRTRLVRDHSVVEALAWCADNKKELRKMESRLEFMLRYQQYIELVRTQNPARMVDAIAHAKRHLSPLQHTYPTECNQAAILLCYPPAEAPADYAAVWSPDRWTMLADLFTRTHNQLLALPAVPLLHLALSSGLSALKTPACHSSAPAGATVPAGADDDAAGPSSVNGQRANGHLANGHHANGIPNGTAAAAAAAESAASTATATTTSTTTITPTARSVAASQIGASVCPICSPELNELARHVPYAHHSKSHAEQETMMLPNGRVYSWTRLEDHARKSGLAAGLIKDLRTGEVYKVEALKKVYIF